MFSQAEPPLVESDLLGPIWPHELARDAANVVVVALVDANDEGD
jgi:hypothetical protein